MGASMDGNSLIVGVLIGVVVGAVVGYLVAHLNGEKRRKAEADQAALRQREMEQQLEALRIDHGKLEARLERIGPMENEINEQQAKIRRQEEELSYMREERGRLETTLQERERAIEEQRGLLQEAQDRLKESFEALSSAALRRNNESFLELARQQLAAERAKGEGEVEARKAALEALVKPINESLDKVTDQIRVLEEKRVEAYAQVGEQVRQLLDSQKNLQQETTKLVQALRTPNQRGRWGEIQLRRVVEMSGMLDRVDFYEQESRDGEDGRLRPDLIVRLPAEKNIVVDAKVPLESYLKAVEAPDENVKREYLTDHARQLRRHIQQLSEKKYWNQFSPAPEMVILFLPGEPIYSAAMEMDGTLIEYGVENRVMIATPMTLITLLRAVAYGWRQEALARDAQKIAEAGEELYTRLITMGDHFERIGRNLDTAVESYNKMVGSLETRVLPAARKLKELQQSASAKEIEEPKPVEKRSRPIQSSEMLSLPGLDLDAEPQDS